MENSNHENIGRYADINGLKMYYEDYGSGIPVILLHGGTITGQFNWSDIVPYLIPEFRVIIPDSRGHGKSTNPSGNLSYKLMCNDIIELTEELNLDHPFVVGYSDGGQIALEIGINYPDTARALVAGGVFYEISEDYLARLKTMGFITRGNVDFKKFENNNPQYAQLLRKLHSSIYGEEYWKDLLIKISEMWMDPDEYPSESAARITVPTLIMHGDHDSIPLDNPIRLYQIIPKAELSIIPNATHTSIFSQSEIVAKIILEFLKRNK